MTTSLISSVLLAGILQGATVAEWDFDQDLSLAGLQLSESSPAADLSGNGNTMLGYDATYSAWYSALGETPSGVGLSLEAQGGQDGYVLGQPLISWSPVAWTIEAAVLVDSASGWRTFIGKDGSSGGSVESDFYLQACGDTGEFRVLFRTVSGQRVDIRSGVVPVLGQWCRLAAVSDGDNASLYVDDGTGYVLAGSAALTGATPTDNALANGGGSGWTFLRGWYNGKVADRIDGRIDNIRFSDVALSPGALLPMGNESHGTVIMISGGSLWFVLGFGWLFGKALKRRSAKK